MKILGEKYVFVPVDKASNNVSIIWKKYYIDVQQNELDKSSTFVRTNHNENYFTVQHHKDTEMLQVLPKDNTLPTMYWVPKLHKTPYKHRFISASSNCSTTNLSIHLTSAFTCIKELVIKYCDKTYQNSNINYFWSVKNSIEVWDKLQSIKRPVSAIDSYDFSTLYTTLPHNLIKSKLGQLIKWSSVRFTQTHRGKFLLQQ